MKVRFCASTKALANFSTIESKLKLIEKYHSTVDAVNSTI